MKKLILCSLLILNSIVVFGQYPEFAPAGATWYYNEYQLDGDLFVKKIKSVQDTFILGHACKKLVSESIPDFYAYRDSLKIYISYYFDSAWFLLYDFSKNVGDTFFAHVDATFADSIPVKILSKSDTIINSFDLPYIITESLDPMWPWNGKAILNIGSDVYFVPPYPLADPSTAGLRCYEDTIIGGYHLVEPCDTTIFLGTETLVTSDIFVIYPNPSFNYFILTTSKTGILSIINQFGQIVQSDAVKDYKTIIPTMNFKSGMYVLTFQSDKTIQTSKLIIQH